MWKRIQRAIRSPWDLNHIIGGSAALIALCGLGLTLYEATAQRRHERRSVLPYIAFAFNYEGSGGGAGWRLSNVGLGPAQVRWFRVYIDGELHQFGEVGRPLAAVEELLGLLECDPDAPPPYYSAIRPGRMVNPGFDDKILWEASPDRAACLRTCFQRVQFKVCYCSLYDECWISSSFIGENSELPVPARCD
jgi:hypothetical protein